MGVEERNYEAGLK